MIYSSIYFYIAHLFTLTLGTLSRCFHKNSTIKKGKKNLDYNRYEYSTLLKGCILRCLVYTGSGQRVGLIAYREYTTFKLS
jgi:hypothetical protein